MNTLAIYCRKSNKVEEGKGTSLVDQKSLGIAKAKSLGWQYEVYTDDGITALNDDIPSRPAFAQMLKDIESGYIQGVFAREQWRIERNPPVKFIFDGILKRNNCRYFLEIGGEVQIDDLSTELFTNMVSLFANYTVRVGGKNSKKGLITRVENGKSRGIYPYGYTSDKDGKVIINPDEAEVVKRVYKLSLERVGTRSIAELLTKEGVKTRYQTIGKGTMTTVNKYTGEKTIKDKKDIVWAGNSIRGILVNPLYKGERNFSGKTYECPAIFDVEYWQKVNDNLTNNQNNGGRKTIHEYLLKGLITCGKCGRNYVGKHRDNTYYCSSTREKSLKCENRGISQSNLDNYIWNSLFLQKGFFNGVMEELKYEPEIESKLVSDIEFSKNKLKALNIKKNKALEMSLEEDYQDDFKPILNKIKTEIESENLNLLEIKTRLESISQNNDVLNLYIGGLSNFRNLTTVEQKAKVLNDFISRILVDYNHQTENYDVTIKFKVNLNDITRSSDFIPINKKYKKKFKEWGVTQQPIRGESNEDLKLPTSDRDTLEIVWCGERNGL